MPNFAKPCWNIINAWIFPRKIQNLAKKTSERILKKREKKETINQRRDAEWVHVGWREESRISSQLQLIANVVCNICSPWWLGWSFRYHFNALREMILFTRWNMFLMSFFHVTCFYSFLSRFRVAFPSFHSSIHLFLFLYLFYSFQKIQIINHWAYWHSHHP